MARHRPVRLLIPSVGIDAKVEAVGQLPGGAMATPLRIEDVGWWSRGPIPADGVGDMVIAGHLDSKTGPAVFYRLSRLRRGADVWVIDDVGGVAAYAVTSNATVSASARPVGLFAADGPARLSLVTCAGIWDGHQYLSRRIVTATLSGLVLAHPPEMPMTLL